MTDREIMQQALEALQKIYIAPEHEEYIRVWWPACEATITALRERLAQPDQEPVATVTSKAGDPTVTMSWWHEPALPVGTKLFTAPQPRQWQGLTDEEIEACNRFTTDFGQPCVWLWDDDFQEGGIHFARAIEAHLKEKNT